MLRAILVAAGELISENLCDSILFEVEDVIVPAITPGISHVYAVCHEI